MDCLERKVKLRECLLTFALEYLSSPLLDKNIKFKMRSTNFACFIWV